MGVKTYGATIHYYPPCWGYFKLFKTKRLESKVRA